MTTSPGVSPAQAIRETLNRWHAELGYPSTRALRDKALPEKISHVTIHDALRGARIPSWRVLSLICGLLEQDPNELRPLYIQMVEANGGPFGAGMVSPPAEREVTMVVPLAEDCSVTIRVTRQLTQAEHSRLVGIIAQSVLALQRGDA